MENRVPIGVIGVMNDYGKAAHDRIRELEAELMSMRRTQETHAALIKAEWSQQEKDYPPEELPPAWTDVPQVEDPTVPGPNPRVPVPAEKPGPPAEPPASTPAAPP